MQFDVFGKQKNCTSSWTLPTIFSLVVFNETCKHLHLIFIPPLSKLCISLGNKSYKYHKLSNGKQVSLKDLCFWDIWTHSTFGIRKNNMVWHLVMFYCPCSHSWELNTLVMLGIELPWKTTPNFITKGWELRGNE